MPNNHGECDCDLCKNRDHMSKRQLQKIYNDGVKFITEEYRIRESRYLESENSIVWRMFTPSYSKLDLVLVYIKPNDSFEIMESKDDIY